MSWNSPETQQMLERAVAHHGAGELDKAEPIYREVLQSTPDHPVALHLLGVISDQLGRGEAAVELMSKALDAAPDYVEARNNLGLALRGLGRDEEAIASFRRAIATNANFLEAHNNLGITLQEQGKLEEAIASYRQAITLNSGFAEAHNNLGAALQKSGKPEEAVASFQHAISLISDYAEAHNNLGIALEDLGQVDDAIASYRQAIAVNAHYPEAHNNLATALKSQGMIGEAISAYEQAIAVNSRYAEAHNNLAILFHEQGRLADAVTHYDKALGIDPNYAEAYRNRASVGKFMSLGDDVQAMETAYANPDIRPEDKMHLAFGLGKVFEDLGDYARAFGLFSQGNALKRASFQYAIEAQAERFAALKRVFDEELFSRHLGSGHDDAAPVFILGMPRSGTSLIEQILASHPQVFGAGEMSVLNRIVETRFDDPTGARFPERLSSVTDDDLTRAGRSYVDEVRALAGGASLVTDKMPGNFRLIGMIKLLMPNATVIHCRRDPLDTCLSIFKTYFTDDLPFAFDLREIGQYYRLYADLMEHWHQVLPGFVHDVQYEKIVASQAESTRGLLEICGLEWDDACLAFHKTDRAVRTASAAQVRRPIFTDSVRSSQNYGAQLAPLMEILQAQ